MPKPSGQTTRQTMEKEYLSLRLLGHELFETGQDISIDFDEAYLKTRIERMKFIAEKLTLNSAKLHKAKAQRSKASRE